MANIKISVKHIYIYIFMIGFFRVHLQELFIVKIGYYNDGISIFIYNIYLVGMFNLMMVYII